jgi:hypothetical protein
VPRAHDAFAEDGALKDAKRATAIQSLAAKLTDTLRKLHA